MLNNLNQVLLKHQCNCLCFVLLVLSDHGFIQLSSTCAQEIKCNPRDYNNDGTVCVCNKDYCDNFPPIEEVPPNKYLFYTSNKDGLRFEKYEKEFDKKRFFFDNTIKINSAIRYQEMLGWGGAFTDAVGIVVNTLDETTREHFLK